MDFLSDSTPTSIIILGPNLPVGEVSLAGILRHYIGAWQPPFTPLQYRFLRLKGTGADPSRAVAGP
jgi:hypothetical protein